MRGVLRAALVGLCLCGSAARAGDVPPEVREMLEAAGLDAVRVSVRRGWVPSVGERVDLAFPADLPPDDQLVLYGLPVLEVSDDEAGHAVVLAVPLEVVALIRGASEAGIPFLVAPSLDPDGTTAPDPHGPNDRLWPPRPPRAERVARVADP